MCPAPDDVRDAPRPRPVGRDAPASRGSRPNPVDDEARLEELSYDECLALLRAD